MIRTALLTIICLLPLTVPAQADTAYIDVTGSGDIRAWPDYLVLNLELADTEVALNDAKDSVDEAFAVLTRIARRLDIESDDIESIMINNYPQYSYPKNGERQLTGHRVVRPVTLNLRELSDYGELLEALFDDERFRVTGTQVRFNEPEAHRSKARRIALLQARTKAENMAETLGQKVTGVLAIHEQGSRPAHPEVMMASPMMLRSAEADNGSAMQIQKQTIEQQVQVRFSIEEDSEQ